MQQTFRTLWILWAFSLVAPFSLLAQRQIILPVPAGQVVAAGAAFDVQVRYDTAPRSSSLTGLGLRLHWDSSRVSLVSLVGVLEDGLIAQGSAQDDLADLDREPQTDRFIQVAWSDVAGSWTAPLPAALFTARFRAASDFSGATRLKFTSSSTAGGFEFSATDAVISRGGPSTCSPDTDTLCLNASRFRVEVDWRDAQGNTGSGQVVPFGSDDSGLFWFFDADNWEMLVKVLDGCSINDHFWLFSAATTNVEYSLTVTDSLTGSSKSYFNPLGTSAPAIADTRALATCSTRSGNQEAGLLMTDASTSRLKGTTNCTAGPQALCLNRSRFLVEVEWRDFQGNTGVGQVVPVGSDDSGLFWFFNADNWEMLVKVLDGCRLNNRYWVFAAATTTVEYRLRVTDTSTGSVKEYFNPSGQASNAITDAGAFATCP